MDNKEQMQSTVDEKKKNDKEKAAIGFLFIALLIFFWIIFNFIAGLFIAIIGVFAVNKILEKKPDFRKNIPAISVVLVFLILGAVFIPAMKSDEKFNNERDEILSGASQTYDYLTEAGTTERNIELAILKTLGHDTNIRGIEILNGEVRISYVAKENLTSDLTLRGLWIDAEDITKELSSVVSQSISRIVIEPYLTLVDQYGKEELSKVASITIKRDTWEKINWENFLTDNLPTIADSYWNHPALND
jgi:predicted PurR-regulated permease PerM